MIKHRTTRELRSPIKKRSLMLFGHSTSVGLEDIFWNALVAEAAARSILRTELVQYIETWWQGRGSSNLSSGIRTWLFTEAAAGTLVHLKKNRAA
jgi:predicted DNA-binding ribbon-helix-helix protein